MARLAALLSSESAASCWIFAKLSRYATTERAAHDSNTVLSAIGAEFSRHIVELLQA